MFISLVFCVFVLFIVIDLCLFVLINFDLCLYVLINLFYD